MRTLSKKTQYSLRALYALTRARGKTLLIADMARSERIPKRFLEQILLKLKSFGFVESKTGKGGGYTLARSPEALTLGEVIRRMEGPLAPLPCASQTAYRKCDECIDDTFCETRLVMRKVRDEMSRILDGTTLADACRQADEVRERSAEQESDCLMYYI